MAMVRAEYREDDRRVVIDKMEIIPHRAVVPMSDRRKTGEGAMKGWATRRRRAVERAAARSALIDVMDEIGGLVVHGVPAPGLHGQFLVGAITLIGWRDRIAKVVNDATP